jgi:hypothetical protein
MIELSFFACVGLMVRAPKFEPVLGFPVSLKFA